MKASELRWSYLIWFEDCMREKHNLTHEEMENDIAELRKTYDVEMTAMKNMTCVYVAEKRKVMKDLKKGEYFTLKKIDHPKESQVYIRGEYDRAEKKYWAEKFDDISAGKYIKPDTRVYTEFIF